MSKALGQIVQESWQRLGQQVALLLPNLLAMLLILAAGWVIARLVQWMLHRMSTRLEVSLRRWGVSTIMGDYGSGAAHLTARVAFWLILSGAILMGVNALNTEIGSRLVTSAFLYLPRLATAGLVVFAGFLLGRFLARGALIWAVNEGIGSARLIASGVRVGVGLLTFVAAAEQLEVARTATLAAFVILLSGTVLAVALAVGLGSRKRVEQWWDLRASFLSGAKEEDRIEHL
ncbi:MAG: hypothetical protein HY238_22895 [Acidobacteria bacterium]|nr:hypothetical protein [Acidobacteriota bacterium]